MHPSSLFPESEQLVGLIKAERPVFRYQAALNPAEDQICIMISKKLSIKAQENGPILRKLGALLPAASFLSSDFDDFEHYLFTLFNDKPIELLEGAEPFQHMEFFQLFLNNFLLNHRPGIRRFYLFTNSNLRPIIAQDDWKYLSPTVSYYGPLTLEKLPKSPEVVFVQIKNYLISSTH
jgi:hypothetical protein